MKLKNLKHTLFDIMVKEAGMLFFLILLSTNLLAQTLLQEVSNEMKYWKLRGRLIGDENNRDVYNGFGRVGEGAGMSLLISRKALQKIENFIK